MGRAQGSRPERALAGFDAAFGPGRGNSAQAGLLAAKPDAGAKAQAARLTGEIRAGRIEEALHLLGAHRTRLERAPLLRALACELAGECFDARRHSGTPAVLSARALLERAGIRVERSDHLVAERAGALHYWPSGHQAAFGALERRDAGRERQRDPYTGAELGRTACGRELSAGEFSRAPRGSWARSVEDAERHTEESPEGAEPEESKLCARCLALHGDAEECRERYPHPLLGAGGDERLRGALIADARSAGAIAGALSAAPSLFELQDALAPHYRRVLIDLLATQLADAPPLELFRMLGARGPQTLRSLRARGLHLAGRLTRADWGELLSSHAKAGQGTPTRAQFEHALAQALLTGSPRG